MKYLLLLLTVCMISINANANQISLYGGYGFGSTFEYGGDASGDGDADGPISIGANYVMELNESIDYGAFVEYALETEDEDSSYAVSTIKLGALGTYSFSPEIYLTGSLGIAIPSTSTDASDTDPGTGLVYGIGAGYNVSDEFSVELGYSITSYTDVLTVSNTDFDVDVDVSSITLTGVYRL